MSNKIFPVLILFVCLCFVMNLSSVEVKKKEINNFQALQKGKFSGTSLDGKGRLSIGPRIKKLAGPEKEYYLALDVDRKGDIYVGTGHKASVFKISSTPAPGAESVTEVFKSNGLDIYALMAKDNGDLYAATSPDGKLFKISKNATKEKGITEFFNPDEKFIWDIKEDKAGNIILATGNSGGVYRINSSGNGVNIFTSEDAHIVSLYITRANSVLAGSGDRGILYKIDNMKVKVLFDSPFEEIRGICEDKDGNIFFSATQGLKKQSSLDSSMVDTFLKKKKKEQEKKPGEKSILYCRRADGVVEKVWTSQSEYIYSICYDKNDNSVLVGTGNSGRVYRVSKDGSFSIVYESEAAQVYKIAPTPNGFSLITNNTATITSIDNTLLSKGLYFSEIFDLEIQSRLGKLYWDAETPNGTSISLAIRSGNSNVPDSTWSNWSAPFTDSDNSSIAVSGVRYFQVKAVLNSANPSHTPRLNDFRVYYIQSNLKPRLKKIDIEKPGEKSGKKNKIIVHPMKRKHHNVLTLSWQASDPNEDKLKYNLYIKKTSDKNWIRIKENITVNSSDLDTRLFDDGQYLLKVVADDSLANPPGMSKTDTLISWPFLIDSTAPVINGFAAQGRNVSFTVDDQTSIVSRVLYSYDGKIWYPVFPVDMIADSKSESFSVSLSGGKSKKYVFLKVVDEFKNSKVFQKEF